MINFGTFLAITTALLMIGRMATSRIPFLSEFGLKLILLMVAILIAALAFWIVAQQTRSTLAAWLAGFAVMGSLMLLIGAIA